VREVKGLTPHLPPPTALWEENLSFPGLKAGAIHNAEWENKGIGCRGLGVGKDRRGNELKTPDSGTVRNDGPLGRAGPPGPQPGGQPASLSARTKLQTVEDQVQRHYHHVKNQENRVARSYEGGE